MASQRTLNVDEVINALLGEEDEDIDWNVSEASTSDDEMDYQAVWEPPAPLDRAEDDAIVGALFDQMNIEDLPSDSPVCIPLFVRKYLYCS